MAIEWTDPPALKAEISRGKPWSYRLPIRDADTDVRWHCRVLPLSALEADPACPARVTVTVPADLDILFGELTWRLSEPVITPQSGRIVFRVLEPRAPGNAPPAPAAAPIAASSRLPESDPAESAARGITAAADEPASPPRAPASRSATHVIEVIRGGATVPGLRVEVRKDRSVTIGRGAQVADHDLDLAGRFETDDLEAYCSRKQAKVFCTDDGVFIRSLGSRPLKSVDAAGNAGDDIESDHRWSVGEVLALPGKLRIVLRQGPC